MEERAPRRSLIRRLLPWGVLVVIVVGIFVQRARIARESPAASDPILVVDFPETVEAGSVQQAVFEIENPGAEDIDRLWISFSLVGVAGGASLPEPLVGPVARGAEPSVVDVDPEPQTAAQGVRFGFGPLDAGETTTIEFDIRVPETPGPAANAVLIYDGTEPQRARGVALETTVGT